MTSPRDVHAASVAPVIPFILIVFVALPGEANCGMPSAEIEPGTHCVSLLRNGTTLTVSARCPTFVLDGRLYGGSDPVNETRENLAAGDLCTYTFAPTNLEAGGQLEVTLHLQWSPHERILRKWARYRVTAVAKPLLLEEVVLEELDTAAGPALCADQATFLPPASYPVLLTNFFVGIEFPVASTRIEAARVILAHRPGLRLESDVWHETRKAIFGTAEAEQEKETFRRYVQAHTPGESRRMFVWETWISVPLRYTEKDQEEVLQLIHDKLLAQHQVTVDACVLTAGWSHPQSIYQLDSERFPGGFERIRAESNRFGLAPGFWISPSAFYPFALDTEWAKAQGYETVPLSAQMRVACIGGSRYQSALKHRVVDMFGKHGMTYAYFDGYTSTCSEAQHGHEPGGLSAEILAANFIDVIQAIREVQPRAWLEATCFGGNASPWWLFHVNTVLGNYGDDCMYGRVPAPVYRDSQTTARDRANLQGCCHSILPIAQQEVFAGLYCHTTEPIVNDAVMGAMRGNMLYLLCTNPRVIDDYGWAALAKLIRWARTNTLVWQHTQPLPPASWDGGNCPQFVYEGPTPREAYGYAHWGAAEGIVAIRNPWIRPTSYVLRVQPSQGVSPATTGLSAISLYPENRTYATGFACGDSLVVPLRPYETLVLWIGKPPAECPQPAESGNCTTAVRATTTRADVCRLTFDPDTPTSGADWMSLTGSALSAIQLDLESDITVDAPRGDLLILLENDQPLVSPACEISSNGKDVTYTLSGPDTGYNADSHPCPEHWLLLRAPLRTGPNHVRVRLTAPAPLPTLSVWAWATKGGVVEGSTYPNSLPQPEAISLDAVELLPGIDGASRSVKEIKRERPRTTINGCYLDSLEIESVSGALVKNANPGNQPLKVFGRSWLRGIGTTAPSRTALTLSRGYRRFQAWVGVDNGTNFADKTRVVFEVWADGEKLWNSAPLTRWDNPVFVDVDVRDRDRLELVTRDEADRGAIDRMNWSDWADARVLR